jgi:hypothetical protein
MYIYVKTKYTYVYIQVYKVKYNFIKLLTLGSEFPVYFYFLILMDWYYLVFLYIMYLMFPKTMKLFLKFGISLTYSKKSGIG